MKELVMIYQAKNKDEENLINFLMKEARDLNQARDQVKILMSHLTMENTATLNEHQKVILSGLDHASRRLDLRYQGIINQLTGLYK